MKTLLLLIVALFSHLTFANEWKHINQNVDGYSVRLSYTSAWSPATYGSEGGSHEGIMYLDVYAQNAAHVQSAEIFEVLKDGRQLKVTSIKMIEDNARHFYGKKDRAHTYGDYIWYKRNYVFKIIVDGKCIEGKFKL